MALCAFAEGLARVEVLRAFHAIIRNWELRKNLSHQLVPVWHYYCADLYSQRFLENGERHIVLLEAEGEDNLAYHTHHLDHQQIFVFQFDF